MIKVLVVDDDKLVRKGLVATMPWAKYGMQVVGEANHGEKALEFLARNEVDLLMTDLVMPIMNGIELMREIRVLYPHMWVVVLTFHQDFEYVQEALRLGAIDYIVKVQLEHENSDDVLHRIVRRIDHERQRFVSPPLSDAGEAVSDETNDPEDAWFLVTVRDTSRKEELAERMFSRIGGLRPFGSGMWLVKSGLEGVESGMRILSETDDEPAWAFIHMTGTAGTDIHVLLMKLRDFTEHRLFYEFAEGKLIYAAGVEEIRHLQADIREEEWEEIGNLWSSLFWVTDDNLYANLLSRVERVRPPISMLQTMYYAAMTEWVRIIPGASIASPPSLSSSSFWTDWRKWLDTVRERLRSQFQKPYSDEITRSIMRAADYVSRHLHLDLTIVDMAKEVHMSRSYFGECFKGVIGKSFHDYVRDMRLTRAKSLLQQTEHPIYRIAEQCGYPNEKYFSRLFREHTGKLPSEFRSGKR